MANKTKLLLFCVLVIVVFIYLIPYRITFPENCEIYIESTDETGCPGLIELNKEDKEEIASFFRTVKIKRSLLSSRYLDTNGELLDDTNHVYMSVYTGQGIQRKKEYQILILFNQNRIIVEEFNKDPGRYKTVICDKAELERFITFVHEKYFT